MHYCRYNVISIWLHYILFLYGKETEKGNLQFFIFSHGNGPVDRKLPGGRTPVATCSTENGCVQVHL